MTRHGNFAPRREDSHANRISAARGPDNKSRLAEVHLVGQRLHLAGSQAAGVMKHRKLIAAKRL